MSEPHTKPETRFTFIEMLFALTIGEVAMQAATLIQSQRTEKGVTVCTALYDARCAFLHLAIAIALVATSWVGWTHSKATGNKEDSKEIFSFSFLVLILDLLLVVVYFILARNVDGKIKDTNTFINDRSTESLWVFVTFVGYALWDMLTKLRRTPEERDDETEVPAKELCLRYVARGWASFLCMLLAGGILYSIPSSVPETGEPAKTVLFTDGALLSLILLFRALKQASENPDKITTQAGTPVRLWPFAAIPATVLAKLDAKVAKKLTKYRCNGTIATFVTLLVGIACFKLA